MNISSIVVQTLPKYLDSVIENLKKSGVCDYHMHDEKGRVIVTIEGENVEEELKKLKVIEAIPHISSADMQMSYSEEELSRHMQVLENSDAVPKILNDKDVKVEDIVYHGDLRRKDLIGFAKQFDKQGN
ncbi:chaperone NapD [Aliarcobacter cibarius]|jgi:periplasmic nitrate reductase NapD|uniref:Chaperone NapD n=1 Tax=Aliarcobacter cibarius TaxID=255507 RepID=A0A5J6RII2_9BACT|nr:chaperone NapD [Aliarcobacter cibarius]QEZ89762.1 periplasmic nitrate reductase assembly protein [Aliarcobacter cibarius]QKJ27771.1 periplasmic nitrate reductase assembly protein [Aliarcobacter cibarius]TLT01077.1 nitrate reductase [Aliarcobacter cibarius]TLT01174.1 nitrate reductase [Aliarcobacter cibarius]TLT04969.1 nitrate reductase [Aliarcobacter cibarius]